MAHSMGFFHEFFGGQHFRALAEQWWTLEKHKNISCQRDITEIMLKAALPPFN